MAESSTKKVASLFLGFRQPWQAPVLGLAGTNIDRIASIHANGDVTGLPVLARAIVDSGPDIIVAADTPSGLALRRAFIERGVAEVPIVMVIADQGEPELAEPMSRGMVTGFVGHGPMVTVDADQKRVTMLSELLGHRTSGTGTTIAVLYHSVNPTSNCEGKELAGQPGMRGVAIALSKPYPDPAFLNELNTNSDLASADAMLIMEDPTMCKYVPEIIQYLNNRRSNGNPLPAIAETRVFRDAGGLLAFGWNRQDAYQDAANIVQGFASGTPLPSAAPVSFEFHANRTEAASMGIFNIPALDHIGWTVAGETPVSIV